MAKTIAIDNITLLQYSYSVDEMITCYIRQEDKARTKKERKKAIRKKRYLRDEAKYNAGQENEFMFFIATLPFIVFNALINSGLKLSKLNFKRYLIAHICLAIKEYFGMSLRRIIGVCKFIFWAMKWKCTVPCFKTLDNYMMRRDTKTIQDKIIEFTVDPLKYIESHFNIDSTCDSLTTSSTWYNWRIKKKVKKRDHLKVHVTSTAKYNAAVAVDVSSEGDAKFIRPHVGKIIKQGFKLRDMSGDSAYLTRDGCNAVSEAGGKAHFKIKSNTIPNAKGSQEWKRTVTAQQNEDPDEIDTYNIRQNAESTNHAKNSKFGTLVRCKLDSTKEAEATMKWCVYNVTAACRAYYDNAINPEYLHMNVHIERLLNYT
jgi:transposase